MVNDITKPRNETNWKLEENGEEIEDEKETAHSFNNYFIEKIEKLKENIDKDFVEEPLEKLKKKWKGKTTIHPSIYLSFFTTIKTKTRF